MAVGFKEDRPRGLTAKDCRARSLKLDERAGLMLRPRAYRIATTTIRSMLELSGPLG
jgi:hypothetical protein